MTKTEIKNAPNNKLIKTEYVFVMVVSMSSANICRRVYTDGNGKYFIKMNHEINDVTDKKSSFIRG